MFGEIEVRTQEQYPEPFPLYPYEEISQEAAPYKTVNQNCALLLRVVRPYVDKATKTERFIGDEFLFEGPQTYIPRIEEEVVREIKASVIKPNTALMVKAKKPLVDATGKKRRAGERWLVRTQGSYMPNVFEEILETRKAYVLTDKKCIQLRALKDMTDFYGVKRQAGAEWLVDLSKAETHILDVNEQFVQEVSIISLSNRQYCYVINPMVNGKRKFGEKELRKGERKFFLQPGEELENNKIQDILVLGEDEGLLLKAKSEF
jgi:major vault protein